MHANILYADIILLIDVLLFCCFFAGGTLHWGMMKLLHGDRRTVEIAAEKIYNIKDVFIYDNAFCMLRSHCI